MKFSFTRRFYGLLILLLGIGFMVNGQSEFVTVEGQKFIFNGKPYHFIGTNFWYGMNLGSAGNGGDRDRLIRELDQLKSLGVNNLRIMGASEGPDTEPWRMVPSLQPDKGKFNEELLKGLDFLLAEMRKRGMKAVVCLNNFWPWSGGMAQYMAWEKGDTIPYPPPAEGGNWATYQTYTSGFYVNTEAKKAYIDFLSLVIRRTNSITRQPYNEDPTIMSWELANEPRGILRISAYRTWIKETAAFIKNLDKNHLVTIGSEGYTPNRLAGTHFRKDHLIENIDYSTIHIWVQNWGWYHPENHGKTFEKGIKKATKYLKKHLRQAQKMNMPMVLEEFGIARDSNDHSSEATTEARDEYYRQMFEMIYQLAKKDKPIAGANFWAWGGEGRPREPKAIWKAGDDFIGDPPHEFQGWYSVYDKDESTLDIIKEFAEKMSGIDK